MLRKSCHLINRINLPLLLLLSCICISGGRTAHAYVDVAHDSQVFGEERNYRVLLPASYDPNGSTSYPVVYYLHGWSERYNIAVHGGLPIADMDEFVSEQDKFIMVILDGSMNPNDPVPNVRPYNIGEDHTFDRGTPFDVQYKDYFLELIDNVDQNFNTNPERESRALFGYSMGGFMAFNLAGKYPHLVSAVVDNMGSPEFYLGDPQRRVLYKKRDLISNLNGVQYRLQGGSRDFLRFLNEEVNQSFQRDPTIDYEFELNDSAHALVAPATGIENFAEGIEYLVNAFQDPLPSPTRWHHADMYADFDKWGYQVTSNLVEEGFIALRGVTQGGFELSTMKWTTQGPYVPGVQLDVQTDALYAPNSEYSILDYNVSQGTTTMSTVMSDSQGRIAVSSNEERHQFGIFQDGDPAELVVVGQVVDDAGQFLTQGQPGNLKLRILNRGGSLSSGLTATISTLEPNVTIDNPIVALDSLGPGDTAWSTEIKITANRTAPENRVDHRIRFDIVFSDGREEEVFVSQFFDGPEFADIQIDDGEDVSADRFGARGTGNGDGIVNPGEQILVYSEGHRLRLFTDDPNVQWLEEEQISELLPSVSGPDFRLTSVVKISPLAPPGTKIRFLADFETKQPTSDPIKPVVHWGAVTLTVAAVPEPSSAVLMAWALLVAAISQRQGRQEVHA